MERGWVVKEVTPGRGSSTGWKEHVNAREQKERKTGNKRGTEGASGRPQEAHAPEAWKCKRFVIRKGW